MRRVVLVCVCALLVAGVAGAQGLPSWCEELPCMRILDPLDGETVQPDTAFLIEVILTPDFLWEGSECELHLSVVPEDQSIILYLGQHQRPRGDSPVFYRVFDTYINPPVGGVITVAKPSIEVGDYYPYRFRILGELNNLPLGVNSIGISTYDPLGGCGPRAFVLEVAYFTVIDEN